MKKTYGAKGLMEWQCDIKSGKAMLHVPFTGGTQTEYGVTPAKYTTENPVIQAMIERSDHFKRGRIVLLSRTGTAAKETATVKIEGKEEKSFATLADAKQWLAAEYNVTASTIKTVADAVAAAAKNGVTLYVGNKK